MARSATGTYVLVCSEHMSLSPAAPDATLLPAFSFGGGAVRIGWLCGTRALPGPGQLEGRGKMRARLLLSLAFVVALAAVVATTARVTLSGADGRSSSSAVF